MGNPKRLFLHSSKAGLVGSDAFLQFFYNPGSSTLPRRSRSSGSFGGKASQIPHAVEPAGAAPCAKVSQGAGVVLPTHLETIKRLISNAGFPKEVAEVVAMDLRSIACVCWGKWSKFLHWCYGRNDCSMHDHCLADSRVLSVSVKGVEIVGACNKGL